VDSCNKVTRPSCPLKQLHASLLVATGSSQSSGFLAKSALLPASNIWGRVVRCPRDALLERGSSFGDEQSTAEGDLTDFETGSLVEKSSLLDVESVDDDVDKDKHVEVGSFILREAMQECDSQSASSQDEDYILSKASTPFPSPPQIAVEDVSIPPPAPIISTRWRPPP